MDASAETVASGFTLLEGPRWRDGQLFASDFFTESVLCFSEPESSGAHTTIAEVPGRPSGLGFDERGRLLVVSMLEMTLSRLESGTLRTVASFGDLIRGPANDMCVDGSGNAYIGSFGVDSDDSDLLATTALVRVDRAGEVTVAASGLTFPNGIALSPDGDLLYVAETYAGRVTRYPLAQDGSLGEPRTEVDVADGVRVTRVSDGDAQLPVLPDGLVVDREGGLWVADAKGHGITRYLGGKQTDFVDTGQLSVYAAELGGSDGRTLFLCCAPANGTFDPSSSTRSELMRARVKVAGTSWA